MKGTLSNLFMDMAHFLVFEMKNRKESMIIGLLLGLLIYTNLK